MRDADTAMYHAKSRGKARHELFDADMHARELDQARPRERPAPRRQHQRLRGALSADRPAGNRHVRRLRVAGPMDPQRQARVTGHVHPARRGTGDHRAARNVGAPAGVLDVRRLEAAVSRCRPRLHHRQRVEPATHAAELPLDRRAGGPEVRTAAVRPPPRNHRDRVDGQPQRGGEAAARACASSARRSIWTISDAGTRP